MTAIDPHELTKRGIQAIRSGDPDFGRELLLEAIELDETIEAAWLGLVEVMEDEQDKITALENALRLNPNNRKAQQQLKDLRDPYRIVTLASDDDIVGDIYQCVYCGGSTTLDDKKCPHCEKKLMALSGKEKRSPGLRVVLGLVGAFQTILAAVLVAPAIMAGSEPTPLTEQVAGFESVQMIFTDFMNWPPLAIQVLLVVLSVRAIVLFVLAASWVRDQTWSFYLGIGLLPLDIILAGAAYVLKYLSIYALIPIVAMDIVLLFSAMLSNSIYAGYAVRELTEFKHQQSSATELFRLGNIYRDQDKWALATLYWQKATVRDSYKANYFHQLSIGYVRLKRYSRALVAINEAAHLEPDNPQIKKAKLMLERQVKRVQSAGDASSKTS